MPWSCVTPHGQGRDRARTKRVPRPLTPGPACLPAPVTSFWPREPEVRGVDRWGTLDNAREGGFYPPAINLHGLLLS